MKQVIDYIIAHWVWFAFALLYICNLLLGHRSQLDSWVRAHPKMGGFLKLVRGFLPADPWLIIQGVSLLAKGTLPAKFAPIVSVIDTPTAALPPPPGMPPPELPPAA